MSLSLVLYFSLSLHSLYSFLLPTAQSRWRPSRVWICSGFFLLNSFFLATAALCSSGGPVGFFLWLCKVLWDAFGCDLASHKWEFIKLIKQFLMLDITAELLYFSVALACCVGFIFPGANPLSRPESPVPEGVLLGLRTRLPLPHVGFVSWRSLSGNGFSLKPIAIPMPLLPRVLPNPTLLFPPSRPATFSERFEPSQRPRRWVWSWQILMSRLAKPDWVA